jgi:hypothetical protein
MHAVQLTMRMSACLAAANPIHRAHCNAACTSFQTYRSVTGDVGASLVLEACFAALVLLRSLQQAPVEMTTFG